MAVEKDSQVIDSRGNARVFSVLPTRLKNREQHANFSAAALSGHPRLFRDETEGACKGRRLRSDEAFRRIALEEKELKIFLDIPHCLRRRRRETP